MGSSHNPPENPYFEGEGHNDLHGAWAEGYAAGKVASDDAWISGDMVRLSMQDSYSEGLAAARAAATPDPPTSDEFTEAAWGLIANAYGGNWSEAPDEWHGAAARWRDEYVAGAVAAPPAASPDERLREAAAHARPLLAVLLEASKSVRHLDPPGYGEADEIHAEAEAALADLAAALAAADREKPDADMQAAMDRADEELRAELDAPLVSDDPVPDPETNT